jgi:hypothetical protein
MFHLIDAEVSIREMGGQTPDQQVFTFCSILSSEGNCGQEGER